MRHAKKPSLYQVHVETRAGKIIPVGPAMLREACESFYLAIRTLIASGKEKTWSNPQVVQIINPE